MRSHLTGYFSMSRLTTETFEKRTRFAAPADTVFDWHLRDGAFERLNPPFEPARIVARSGGIADGGRVELQVPVGPFRQSWISEHRGYVPGVQFQDVQIRGPFASCVHTHRVEADGPHACYLDDKLEYRLPFGPLGTLGKAFVTSKLQRMFDYRHRLMAADIAAHQNVPAGVTSMKILVVGATGLVGSALVPLLTTGGHTVHKLSRSNSQRDSKTIVWDPTAGKIPVNELEGFDAVIHLAGEGIATRRWTAAQKARIRDSRVGGTSLLAGALAKLNQKPKHFLCASAIGFYGDRGDEVCAETSAPGTDFLADVCQAWEKATQPVVDAGIRVVNMRIGVVMSPQGGALKKMLTPFKLGVGGVLGSGKQYMSCITIDDVGGGIYHCLTHEELTGPVNLVDPYVVTNRDFTKTLGRILQRPTIFPAPAFVLRLAVGEMADALLLSSTRVVPNRLLSSGYQFRFPDLESGLKHVLGLK